MRTAILFVGICIADAISKDWRGESGAILLTVLILIFLFMDIYEFLHNLSKK